MLFITFSREFASGGTEIAKRVAERLNCHYFDTEAINQAAEELGFLQEVKKVDEKPPSFFQQLFSDKVSSGFFRLHSVIYELAKRGDAVFLGRGSSILLKDLNCALRVRIVASREKRVENLLREGYRKEEADQILQKTDRERDAFIKFVYGVNWDDARYYDLVLNMDKLSTDMAVETVVNLARSSDIRTAGIECQKAIEVLALTSRLQAAIVDAGSAFDHGHSVSVSVTVPEPGKVVLSGWVANEAGKKKAEDIVRSIKGVETVENTIRIVRATRVKD